MKTLNPLYRTSRRWVGVLGVSLLSTACILSGVNDDDDDDDGGGAGTSSPTAGQNPGTDGFDGDTTGGDVDPGPLACEGAENLVLDPGFEDGAAGVEWRAQSVAYDTPICDAMCTDEEGAAPFEGDWWVWFGGRPDLADTASVEQDITVLEGPTAELSFRFRIRSGAGTGDDTFMVELVDGETTDTIFMATDTDMPSYDGSYRRVDLDISDWADGGTYTLRFSSGISGNGLTSFFLDDVRLASCGGSETGTDTGVATVGQADTTAGSSGADDTAGSTSGSSDGGSDESSDGSGSSGSGSGSSSGA